MTVDLLCKVVDNFGDIGVVYRLARALSEIPPPPGAAAPALRLVVDDLESFRHLCPDVDPRAFLQTVRGWTVAAWQASPEAIAAFSAEPPALVVEAFACGRPDWFEELLFDPRRPGSRLVINLEYLTAEDWADDFHLMDSLTRSSEVKKRFFMPGFTQATGGLILDRSFMEARAAASTPEGLARLRGKLLAGWAPALSPATALSPAPVPVSVPALADALWCSVFSYERDYTQVVADLAACAADLGSSGRLLLALAAAGKSQPCFLAAWEKAGRPFPVLALPFLAQETWDSLLAASDFSIVRGEDSLTRAALAGRPFLWQAYPQEGRHQLVKVRALLGRLRPFFEPAGFEEVAAAFLAFNDRDLDTPGTRGEDPIASLLAAAAAGTPAAQVAQADAPASAAQAAAATSAARAADQAAAATEAAAAPRLRPRAALAPAFRAFSESLVANGNLALPLLGLFRDFV